MGKGVVGVGVGAGVGMDIVGGVGVGVSFGVGLAGAMTMVHDVMRGNDESGQGDEGCESESEFHFEK